MASVFEKIGEYCLARSFFMWEQTKFTGEELSYIIIKNSLTLFFFQILLI